MTDVIELSSDDDNISNKYNSDTDTSIELNIDDIVNKYKNINTAKTSQETISSSDSDLDDIKQFKSLKDKLYQKYDLLSSNENLNVPEKDNLFLDTSESDENKYIESPKPKKRRSINKEERLLNKIQKEQEKAKKQEEKNQEKAKRQAEKEQKKAEAAKAKADKQALASAYKNLKPEECIKFTFVSIDSDLMSNECGADIPNILQGANINYKVNSNIQPFTITWKRNNQTQLTTIDGQLKLSSKNDDQCEEILLIILWNEFINLVHENNLNTYYKNIRSILPDKKIFFGIYGLENYFKFQKSQKQKLTAKDKIYTNSPKISRKDVDMSLIELQLLFNVSHRFVETPQDVSAMVLQFTKSIAQIPYKLQKEMKQQQMDWFVSGDNKDCVRVDKNGNGLYRLWQQQLTQFTLARLETAEAISSKYNSPSTLMKAYEECNNVDEGEKLLQDIPIRRAAGPLASVRKIGPEFSKKMHTLFTSLDGDILL